MIKKENKSLRVSLVQKKYKLCQSFEENYQELSKLIRKAAKQEHSKLIILPELSRSPYFCQQESLDNFSKYSEKLTGESFQIFSKLAKELKILISFSIFEESENYCYYNTSLIVEKDGSLAGFYRKVHIPHDPCFYEKFYFKPGDKLEPISTSVGKLGVLICWDQWFPEAARAMALKGAQLIIYPTAVGSLSLQIEPQAKRARQIEAWLTIQKSHSIANGCFIACANRVGLEKTSNSEINFWGKSFFSNPSGEITKIASEREEEIITENLNLDLVRQSRLEWPFFRDLKDLKFY